MFFRIEGSAVRKLLPWSWWRNQMEKFSALLAICAGNSPVHGEFPAQRPVTRSFDVFFDLRLNKRLSKQSCGWWFETLSCPLWSHCNVHHTETRAWMIYSLQWRHNGRDSLSNRKPHDCFLNRLFRRRSKKTSKIQVTGLCAGKSPGPVNSPHKWPVARKKFPFDDVIVYIHYVMCRGVITYPFPNLNDGLTKPPSNLVHGWVIAPPFYMDVIIYD